MNTREHLQDSITKAFGHSQEATILETIMNEFTSEELDLIALAISVREHQHKLDLDVYQEMARSPLPGFPFKDWLLLENRLKTDLASKAIFLQISPNRLELFGAVGRDILLTLWVAKEPLIKKHLDDVIFRLGHLRNSPFGRRSRFDTHEEDFQYQRSKDNLPDGFIPGFVRQHIDKAEKIDQVDLDKILHYLLHKEIISISDQHYSLATS